jgi:chemotaxis response regulator CheB
MMEPSPRLQRRRTAASRDRVGAQDRIAAISTQGSGRQSYGSQQANQSNHSSHSSYSQSTPTRQYGLTKVVLITGSGHGGYQAACDMLGSISDVGSNAIIIALVPDAQGGYSEADFEGVSRASIKPVTAGTRFESGNVYVAPQRGSFDLSSNGRFSCTPPASYRVLGVEILNNATRNLADLYGDKLVMLVLSGSRKSAAGIGQVAENVTSNGGSVIIQAGEQSRALEKSSLH